MIDSTRPAAGGAALPGAALGTALIELLEAGDIPVSFKELAGGTHVRVNAAYARMLGRIEADIIDHTDAELWAPTQWASVRNAEVAALARGGPSTGDLKLDAGGGTMREWRLLRMPLGGDPGPATHLLTVWLDQTAARRREAQLQTALAQLEQLQKLNDQLRRDMHDGALRDPVTGLASKAHFDDQLRREVDLSLREHREFSMVGIELDPPNETVAALGDAARRRIVEALGRLLRNNTRAMDASCRLDGERFAVLLSGVGLATAHSRMEQLRRQCATQIVLLDSTELTFTVSMGVASFPHTASTQESLLQACEGALAQARQRGGNCVALASIKFEST